MCILTNLCTHAPVIDRGYSDVSLLDIGQRIRSFVPMDREIDDVPSARFLWERKSVVPLLKIDRGLTDVADGVQLMKPIPGSTTC